MIGIRTVAVSAGMLAGAWVFGGSYFGGIGRALCGGGPPCVRSASPNFYVVAIAVLLVLNSVVCFFGPRVLFYASGGLSILLAGSVFPSSPLNDPVVWVAFGLAFATLVLSVLAARRMTEVSEQANPMNLPVFG